MDVMAEPLRPGLTPTHCTHCPADRIDFVYLLDL
jgi:hypothetical protein